MTVAAGFGAATTTFGAHVLILRRSVKGVDSARMPPTVAQMVRYPIARITAPPRGPSVTRVRAVVFRHDCFDSCEAAHRGWHGRLIVAPARQGCGIPL